MTIDEYRAHLVAHYSNMAQDIREKIKTASTEKERSRLTAAASAWEGAMWYAKNAEPN